MGFMESNGQNEVGHCLGLRGNIGRDHTEGRSLMMTTRPSSPKGWMMITSNGETKDQQDAQRPVQQKFTRRKQKHIEVSNTTVER